MDDLSNDNNIINDDFIDEEGDNEEEEQYQEEGEGEEGEEEDNENKTNRSHDNNLNNEDNIQNENENDSNLNEQNQNQNQTNNKEEEEEETLDIKIKRVFEYYSSYGERMNFLNMGSTKFLKFATDSGLISNSILSKTNLDLIFSSITKKSKKLNLSSFTNSLVLISNHYSAYKNKPQLSKKDKLLLYLNENFLPLYFTIFSQNHENELPSSSVNLSNSEIFLHIPEVLRLIEEYAIELFSIYKAYFKYEIEITSIEKIEYIKEMGMKRYLLFLKDFDICPRLINKSNAVILYESLIEVDISNEDLYCKVLNKIDFGKIRHFSIKCSNIVGIYFTFFKFIRIFVRICDFIGNDKKESFNILSLFDSICLIIERMENSNGFSGSGSSSSSGGIIIEGKKNKRQKEEFLLLKSKLRREIISNYMKEVNESKTDKTDNNNINQSNNENENDGKDEVDNKEKGNKSIEAEENKSNSEEYFKEIVEFIYETYGNELLSIFEYFCGLGTFKNESKSMKSSLFNKFLKESDILMSINNTKSVINKENHKENDKDKERINKKYNQSRKIVIIDKSNSKQNTKFQFNPSQNNEFGFINNNQVDIIFNYLLNRTDNHDRKRKGIDYETFIYGIAYISSIIKDKISQSTEDDVTVKDMSVYLIQEKILPLKNRLIFTKNQEKQERLDLLDALKQESEEDISIIKAISNTFQSIYIYYSSDYHIRNARFKGLLTLNHLLTFCQDFKIFPQIVSRTSITYYFNKKSQEISEQIRKELKSNEDYIDFSGFIDIVCLFGIELPMTDEPFFNRINFLIDHFENSNGKERIYLKSGNKVKVESIKSLYRKHLPSEFRLFFDSRKDIINENSEFNKSSTGFYDILVSN